MADYEPGECNIGRAERRKRRIMGISGLGSAAALVVVLLWATLPDSWVVLAVFPLFVGYLGFLQDRESFCVGFALGGLYDVSEEGIERHRVEDQDARRADLLEAMRLQVKALVAALVTVVVFYALARAV